MIIFKYTLHNLERDTENPHAKKVVVPLREADTILCTRFQKNILQLWVLHPVYPITGGPGRTFYIYNTGSHFNPTVQKYIGTSEAECGEVFHVFEEIAFGH